MKKIMFNDKYGLTLAVFEGRKTMTRRIVPQCILDEVEQYRQDYYNGSLENISYGDALSNMVTVERMFPKYCYKIGEVVAVALRYKDFLLYNHAVIENGKQTTAGTSKGWNNKMFVRSDLMPHHIKITDIKVERLQDISDEDILREGVFEGEFMNTWDRYYYDEWGDVANHITFRTPRKAFASLIDKVSGKGTWDKNPWVFAYSFKLID